VGGSRIGGYEGMRGEVGIGVSRLRLRRMCRLGNGGGVWKCRSFFGDGLCRIGHMVWKMRRVL